MNPPWQCAPIGSASKAGFFSIPLRFVTEDAIHLTREGLGRIASTADEIDIYGMVTGKYGISWQFSHDSGKLIMGG